MTPRRPAMAAPLRRSRPARFRRRPRCRERGRARRGWRSSCVDGRRTKAVSDGGSLALDALHDWQTRRFARPVERQRSSCIGASPLPAGRTRLLSSSVRLGESRFVGLGSPFLNSHPVRARRMTIPMMTVVRAISSARPPASKKLMCISGPGPGLAGVVVVVVGVGVGVGVVTARPEEIGAPVVGSGEAVLVGLGCATDATTDVVTTTDPPNSARSSDDGLRLPILTPQQGSRVAGRAGDERPGSKTERSRRLCRRTAQGVPTCRPRRTDQHLRSKGRSRLRLSTARLVSEHIGARAHSSGATSASV
jgi:hypothetical protein